VKIRAIRLWNVRRFGNRGVAIEGISDGVNVLAAENEQGKSTCFDALHALLFQPYSGTPKPIQMLRPYSGGSPRVEANIETDAGLFRIAKQFYAGREATVTDLATQRLVAQADQAEAWISDLTRGGASGPTGLLWVRQGLTDFDSGGKAQRDQEQKVREDALSSVAGEVEALTGGRRMFWILERCETELNEMVTTTGQARKGGPYALAREEHEQLRTEEQLQAALVDALRAALDERKRKTARRAEFADPAAIETRRQDKERTAAEFEIAKRHADRLADAIGRHKSAAGLHHAALEDLNRYRAAMERAVKLTAELNTRGRAHSDALAAQSQALKTEEDARRTLAEAEAGYTAARDTYRRAEAGGRANDARKRLAELKGKVEKAELCQNTIEQLTAQERALAIPKDTVAKLETLDTEISNLRTKLDASSALVVVEYGDNPDGSIRLDGAPIGEGETRSVSHSARFDIPNIATLTISAGASVDESTSKALEDKRDAFEKAIDKLGVATLSALRARERDYLGVKAELQIAKAELSAFAPDGLDALKIEASQLETLVGSDDAEAPDQKQAAHDLEVAETQLNQVRTTAETSRAQLATIREAVLREKLGVDHLGQTLTELQIVLGPEEARPAALDRLEKTEASNRAQLTAAAEQVTALKANAPDLEAADAAARRAASVVANVEAEVTRLDQEISELTGSIRARSKDAVEEVLAETRDRLTTAEARLEALETEAAVLSRLKKALGDAQAVARDQYFGPVMAELRPLLALLLDEAKITFNDDTLLPRSLERNGQDEDVSVLSGGMREQLTVLTRLAFARLLAKNGRPVPVILDDALVYSDDDRIERMFDALHRQARDLQIIVFSCRQRAFAQLGGQGLHMVNWTPESRQ
jgi:hypothetical protein